MVHRTRLLVMSDLHQSDGGLAFDPTTISRPFDVVVVAGDAAGRLTMTVEWLAGRFAGMPVVYVPGNHDFYRDGAKDGFTIEEETEAGLNLAARRGIHLLIDSGIVVGGIRFLGATMWTDLRAGVHHKLTTAIGDARRGMNDYRRIHRKSASRRSRRIDPSFTRHLHLASLRFLETAASSGIAERTVVVTHPAPSLQSLPVPAGDLDHCYASDLDAEILRWRPALWVHGHIHAARDYVIGATRVVCNPWGRAEEHTGFDLAKIITLSFPSDTRETGN